MNQNLAAIEQEMVDLKRAIAPLNRRMHDLERMERAIRAGDFVAANEITLADVQLSKGDGMPDWFGTIFEFIEWMKANGCSKRFAEWNEIIYFTSDLLAGRMPTDMPATLDDIPKGVKPQ